MLRREEDCVVAVWGDCIKRECVDEEEVSSEWKGTGGGRKHRSV